MLFCITNVARFGSKDDAHDQIEMLHACGQCALGAINENARSAPSASGHFH